MSEIAEVPAEVPADLLPPATITITFDLCTEHVAVNTTMPPDLAARVLHGALGAALGRALEQCAGELPKPRLIVPQPVLKAVRP